MRARQGVTIQPDESLYFQKGGCLCLPTSPSSSEKSAKDEKQLLLPLAMELPQPQETEGALLPRAHSAGSAFSGRGQME